MDKAERILDTIRQLYDAKLETGDWDKALQLVIAAVGGDKGVLLGEDRQKGVAEFVLGCDLPTEVAATFGVAYEAGLIKPWLNAIAPDTALVASSIVPDPALRQSTFYNKFVRPTGLFYSALASIRLEPHQRAIFAIGRVEGRDDYSAENIETLRLLVPHLSTALRMNRQFGKADLLAGNALAVLDQLGMGVILADARARPQFVNQRARAIAAQTDGLFLSTQGIAAAVPGQTRTLQSAIAAMAAVSASLTPSDTAASLLGPATTAAATRLRLSRLSLKPPLAVEVMPLCGVRYKDLWGSSSSVAVLITEPDKPLGIDAKALAETYGLAPRETQVAVLLAQGLSPRGIADTLGIGIGTTREHLKRVLAKTRAHRQANLVRMILTDFT